MLMPLNGYGMRTPRPFLSLTQVHVSSLWSLRVRAALIHSVQQLLLHLSNGVAVQAFDCHLRRILVLRVHAVQCLHIEQSNQNQSSN